VSTGTLDESTPSKGGPMRRRVRLFVAVLVVLVVLLAGILGVLLRPAPVLEEARAAGQRFLETYVEADGRVVRHDQGGDTVGEGQAYALLIAVALEDASTFARVWRWTDEHLRRDDGLLAHHWADGAVQDHEAAADADLDAAHALLLAAERFSHPAYREAALELADGIVAKQTAAPAGNPVLVAGPWARRTPAVVNPSYFSPLGYHLLGNALDDPAWQAITASSYDVADATLERDSLPPDWLLLEADGSVTPIGHPDDRSVEPVFGPDAARLPIRFAVACEPAGRELAARTWPAFEELDVADFRLRHSLDGAPSDGPRHPVTVVAAAAAAHAAGDNQASRSLLDAAEEMERGIPTYYGSAWVALGRLLLGSDVLGSCT
jgi:endoglucanase